MAAGARRRGGVRLLVLAPLNGIGPAWARSASPPVAAADSCRDSEAAGRLNAAITDTAHRTGAPGVLVGVRAPHCGYEKAFGVTDKATGAPMRTDFYSRIGSETK